MKNRKKHLLHISSSPMGGDRSDLCGADHIVCADQFLVRVRFPSQKRVCAMSAAVPGSFLGPTVNMLCESALWNMVSEAWRL